MLDATAFDGDEFPSDVDRDHCVSMIRVENIRANKGTETHPCTPISMSSCQVYGIDIRKQISSRARHGNGCAMYGR